MTSGEIPRQLDDGGVCQLEQGLIYTLMEFLKYGQRPCAESNERIDICKEIVKNDIIHLHPLLYLIPSGGAF